MISKKILALVLAISVVVCALPAFSVAAEEALAWPDVAETLENVQVKFANALIIDVSNASPYLKATAGNGLAASGGMKISGEVVFAGKTIKINNMAVTGGSGSKNLITTYGSTFATHDKDFLADMVAANLPEYEYVNGEISTGAKSETIRNFVRYIMYLKGEDYNAVDNLLTAELYADSATITVEPLDRSFMQQFPAGSYYLPTVANYVKHGKNDTFRVDSGKSMYAPVITAVGTGPYALYSVDKTGEYKVWLVKRDRVDTTAEPSGNTNRDVYFDFCGKTLNFTGTEGLPTGTPAYVLVPEDSHATVKLTAGKKYMLQINNRTGNYADSFGLLLVPADKVTDEVAASITGKKVVQADGLAAYATDKSMGRSVDHEVPAEKTANVTVNGAEVAVTSNTAQEYYPNVSLVEEDGAYIEDVTILDAIVAADKAGVELPFEIDRGDSVSNTVTPITYDTTIASGNAWPTNASNTNGGPIWGKAEVCYMNNSSYATTVKAPEAGNYYAIVSGMTWGGTTRYIGVKVNGNDVYLAEGNKKFRYAVSTFAAEVGAVPVALNKGDNTVQISANGGICRIEYVAFIKADNYDAAVALAKQITANRTAFEEYFAAEDAGSVYSNGKFTKFGGLYMVDGIKRTKALEIELISDNAEIEIAEINKDNLEPISMGKMNAYGGTSSGDRLQLHGGYEPGSTKDYSAKFVTYDFAAFPVDLNVVGAVAGCYLNGYITVKQDLVGATVNGLATLNTTGDDRLVKIYVHDWKITASARGLGKDGSDNRAELGIIFENIPGYGSNNAADFIRADLNSEIEGDETYHPSLYVSSGNLGLYDLSNLYLTNTKSAAPIKVTATKKADGVYNLTSNKTVPVCLVKVTKVDGVVTSTVTENTFIDFMDADGIDVEVAENQTIYVWQGTALPVGTNMSPLCAPLTR